MDNLSDGEQQLLTLRNERGLTIYVDIDDTICRSTGTDYDSAAPIPERISFMNQLAEHHKVVYWTARGSVTGIDHLPLTMRQLAEWGVKYHALKMGKPAFDLMIDDKALNAQELGKAAK